MGIEYSGKFSKNIDEQQVKKLLLEIAQFPNIEVEKQNNSLVFWWTHYNSRNEDTLKMGDVRMEVNKTACYVCINSSRYPERRFLFFMIDQLFRIYDIQCHFEEL